MSSVKDNVGRGLNIALVNGEFPGMWGDSSVQEGRALLWLLPMRRRPGIVLAHPSPLPSRVPGEVRKGSALAKGST